MKINVKNIGKNPLPQYAHYSDAGFDLRADFSHPDTIMTDGGEWDDNNISTGGGSEDQNSNF